MPGPIPKPGRAMKGRIAELWRGRSCGFIRTSDGQTVFFHARDLERLKYNDIKVSLAVLFELIEDVVSGPRAARIRTDAPKKLRAVAAKPEARSKARGARLAPASPASAPK